MSVTHPSVPQRATLADLMRVEGKAELIGGRIVTMSPTGFQPGMIGEAIHSSLKEYARALGRGLAIPDNVGFAVPELASGRESFSPDVAYHVGPLPADGMDFVPGAPIFAVEVRSKSDYGPAAERDHAAKRRDYFEAGTRVVWDVDPRAECVRKYVPDAPDTPTVFERGQEADAEPAVPGWRVAVDRFFDL